MLMYQPDSPSRMCVMIDVMRRPAWWIALVSVGNIGSRSRAYVCALLSSSHTHTSIHIASTSGLVWRI
jgi:hypothetical protein